ncbi:reverse transcriptase [Senna tora]|uniref:Reverse transcriptase n=1 Tax=Senna tora TaxID=362788 RepID=A0A834X8P4_9FABA|nr:reverse transcriptase [Senna tora]
MEGKNNNKSTTIDLCWSPSPEGYFKLNVDGSFMVIPGVMAAVGVIRNHLGHWVSGFSKFRGSGSFPPQFDFCKINHAYREKNRCVDSLAITAIKSRNSFVIYNTVPNELFLLFWADLSGINYARNCKGTFDPV